MIDLHNFYTFFLRNKKKNISTNKPDEYDLISKEINKLLNRRKSVPAKQNSVLKYIRNIGHLPVIINHQQYKKNKLILFIHKEMIFVILIFRKISKCHYSPINIIKDLDIKLEKDQKKITDFLEKNCVGCWGFCLDFTYNSAKFYKNICKNYSSFEYYNYYFLYQIYNQSTQLLHILFEK